ncbi:putative membrane protein YCR023C [Ceratocystis fimbriata CBS 114723]|uniref:Putative membrane protein YCR023C n=1 Tax=Ceratocystis fimbriata CBS 114723 TaxID=1035309 RepID=A0A2C5WXT6_9PEZI|nr:putative membrane protein YCR023C [Ceratocystis fimbriata CBS 114723]
MTNNTREQRPLLRREPSTPHYQTLPVTPPPLGTSLTARSSFSSFHAPRLPRLLSFKSRLSSPPSASPSSNSLPQQWQTKQQQRPGNRGSWHFQSRSEFRADFDPGICPSHTSPLPYRQLCILALLSLSEQSALNSMGPYLPAMLESFHDVPSDQVSLYIGLLASSFALAQLCSNFLWGFLSDRIGRKPVLMMGSLFLLCSCVGFGFSTSFRQAVILQTAMGVLNGNAAVFPTVVGELTDRSNQSTAFTWLPIVYSLGSITGPAMGGLFAGRYSEKYPYAAPNLFSAGLLAITLLVVGVGFREPDHGHLPRSGRERHKTLLECLPDSLRSFVRRNTTSASGALANGNERNNAEAEVGAQETTETEEESDVASVKSQTSFFSRTTVLLLASYFIFQLCSVAFATLYPVFAASPAPAGRSLDPATIGLLMTIAGFVTMGFQAFIFPTIKTEHGNIGTYRFAVLGLAVSLALMPLVGYLSEDKETLAWNNLLIYGEISTVLINNSCPDSQNLGALYGIAQSLSAAGRSLGPIIAGSIFSFAVNIAHEGAMVAWCLFSAIAMGGWLGSLVIHCPELESDDYRESHRADMI